MSETNIARAFATRGLASPGRIILAASRSIGGMIGTIVVSSLVIFAALSLAPGDPVAQMLGARATDASRAAMRAELGLDDPLAVRYWNWLMSAIHGDLGTSYTFRESVAQLVGSRMETTALVVLMSAVIVIVSGLSLGVVGGAFQRARPFVAALVSLSIAVPSFVSASALIGIFAVQLRWFPTYGTGEGLFDSLWHLVLPAVALSLGYASYVAQMSSAAVSEEYGKDFVLAGRGRGLSEAYIFRNHVLRNALLPVLTASGLAVAGLVSGTLVVEQIFSIDGIGSLLIQSIISKDYGVVMAISLIIVIVFVVVTTAVDLLQSLLDPRTRSAF